MDNFVSSGKSRRSVMNAAIARRATVDALRKLNPVAMMRNPVMLWLRLEASSPRRY
jgi:high-affinity K+ transport system ATPase subunit B